MRPDLPQKYLADALPLSDVVQELQTGVSVDTFVFLVNDFGLDEVDCKRVTDQLYLGSRGLNIDCDCHSSHFFLV